MITKIDDYYLKQPINEAPDLTEFDTREYELFEAAGYIRMWKDEKIYHGKETNLNGILWDTVIGATNGNIYKISLQIMETDKRNIENIFKSTLDYMVREMGNYNKCPSLAIRERYIWDTEEGNVICEQLSQFGQFCINVFITSSLIGGQVEENRLKYLLKTIAFKFKSTFGWNSLEHSGEENLRWSWLRAIEWGIWPAFLSGPVVPLLLPFAEWWEVIGIVVILTIFWSFIRYKYINLSMASFGVYFVLLRWVACPMAAIYLAIQHKFILAILSLLWPMLASYLGIFVGGTQIGKIQKMFMAELGYSENK